MERDALLAALAWQIELGADEAIGDAPVDRTALPDRAPSARAPDPAQATTKAATRATRATRATKTATATAAKAPAEARDVHSDARALAAGAEDLAGLRAALDALDRLKLKEGARSCVFADGNPAARVMVVGEAPGREEDRSGKPFVGRSGKLLDRMLAAIDLFRGAEDPGAAAYVTNVIFYRPLENRTPDDREVSALLPFTERHIALARPDFLLCLGNVPAKHLMQAGTGITRFRGTWATYERGGLSIPALATFHPAFLLRSPEQKRQTWRDLLSLRARLDGETG